MTRLRRFRGATMKKLLVCISAVALIGTPVFAADMAFKAPPPAPGPISWTGWYAGLNAGGTWSDSSINTRATNVQFCTPAQTCANGLVAALASAQGATGEFSGNNSGVIGAVNLDIIGSSLIGSRVSRPTFKASETAKTKWSVELSSSFLRPLAPVFRC